MSIKWNVFVFLYCIFDILFSLISFIYLVLYKSLIQTILTIFRHFSCFKIFNCKFFFFLLFLYLFLLISFSIKIFFVCLNLFFSNRFLFMHLFVYIFVSIFWHRFCFEFKIQFFLNILIFQIFQVTLKQLVVFNLIRTLIKIQSFWNGYVYIIF